jgi:hypothetical protein
MVKNPKAAENRRPTEASLVIHRHRRPSATRAGPRTRRRGAAAVVRRAQARPAVAARQRRRGGQGVRGVGVGGDAAADAGTRRRRLLRPVDGALAHCEEPRRRHAGGEKRLG